MLHNRRPASIFLSIIMMLFVGLSLVQPESAAAQAGDGLRRELNAQSGRVSFIGPESGRALSAARALGISPSAARPADPALALARRFAPEFGLKNPGRDLAEVQADRSEAGRLTVRYQQNHEGVPVLGGELIVNTNENGDLYSINGEVSPDLSLQTQPAVAPERAAQAALQAAAKWYQVSPADFTVSAPELWIFDESLLRPGARPAELVWRMEVTPVESGMPLRELVLVDAQRGSISLHFNQVDTSWKSLGGASSLAQPRGSSLAGPNAGAEKTPALLTFSPLANTYTANGASSLPGSFRCNQSQPNCTNGSDPHADAAHRYALGTFNLYDAQHNRNSVNNSGMVITSTVHYCSLFECPYSNAFWSGSQIVYGDGAGWPLADDVVAHEYTHGVTQYESRLFYYYQSGAINESFSDVWGEYYDQTNGLGNDSAGVRWLVGEDIAGYGAIRNMSDPPVYGNPDKMTSMYYYEGEEDYGGVHYNSGVNNKAVFLMVDGGSFNGRTVSALGWVKTAAIYYEAQSNLLSSGADYSDLYYALQQACSSLVDQKGITTGDCTEVKDALDAVEMNIQPAPNFNTDAALCGPGTLPKYTFRDDLESGAANWTFTNGTYTRWQVDSPYGSYVQSGLHSLYADDYPGAITDASARLNGILIPSNAYLHFAHAYGFETFFGSYYDGGVLEYSTNGGASWVDAGSLIDFNGYPGVIATGSGNPIEGRSAFVGASHGYISTRLNLTPLGGKTVNFRWRMGLDVAVSDWGWWVDNVRIYQCLSDTVSLGIYDDSYYAWSYTGNWTRYSGSGPYSNTLMYSQAVGSSARMFFNGQRFILTYTGNTNRGKLDVFVDGAKLATINQYSSTAQWQKKWVSPVLPAGRHEVSLVHAGEGTYVDVDAIQIKNPDLNAPAAITNLAAVSGSTNGSVNLSWTAVGDDGATGSAGSYAVRYGESPISAANWDAASIFPNSLIPKAAGGSETLTVTGLTPGVIYYFAVRAQDEDLNEGNVSNSPSAAAKAPAPVGPGIYDDNHAAWVYSSGWAVYTGGGPYAGSLHYTGAPGATASFIFTGARFKLTYTKHTNRGLIDVFVDGVKVDTLNANSASLQWQATYTSPVLSAGSHTVRLVNGGSSGTYIDVDAIQVFAHVPAGIYDNANSSWAYSGTWATYNASGPYAGTLYYTNTPGSSAELLFTGARFKLTYTKNTNRGPIDVYVDGVKIDTINANSASLQWQATYTSPVLSAGNHTVRFVHAGAGSAYIDIDAIQVFAHVPAGIYDNANINWLYSGTWAPYSGGGPYAGTLYYTNTPGSSAELLFTGARFTFTFTRYSNRGLIDVYVDGSKIATIDASNPTLQWQAMYTSPLLSAGNHTVRFVYAGAGSTYIDVDAIQVVP